jgi:2-amino-4-hydroxy-6-hydroxymethyldihydropteridine diphosphokinase/dihydropteroate synthase
METLERAAQILSQAREVSQLRASPVFQTQALVPEGAPADWSIYFLNAVVELHWNGSAQALLALLQRIEQELGRAPAPRWAPRAIDLDLLAFGNEVVSDKALQLPHPGVRERAFVLEPLKQLAPRLRLPGDPSTILDHSRRISTHHPLWFGILNFTPDSFSDGDALGELQALVQQTEKYEMGGIQVFDLGAESTRPGASPVNPQEEMARLRPALEFFRSRYQGRIFRPWLSVDTRHAAVAAMALEYGATILNDVSGLADPALEKVLVSSSCQYVLMHNLGVPADPKTTINEEDPVLTVKRWAERKLERLEKIGVNLDRIFFDPGIGFGKTATQNQQLLHRIDEFLALPVRLLVGHSRKSFLNHWGERKPKERDGFGVGVSLRLAQRGVDALRVHEPALHASAFHAFQELGASP